MDTAGRSAGAGPKGRVRNPCATSPRLPPDCPQIATRLPLDSEHVPQKDGALGAVIYGKPCASPVHAFMRTTMGKQMINPRKIAWILLFGAIGGGLSLVYAATVGQPIRGSHSVALPGSVVLGTFAAFIGVYVIANTDTSNSLRYLRF
jgi:hypothetical protein